MSGGQQKTLSSSLGRLRLGLDQDMAQRDSPSGETAGLVEQTREAMYQYVFTRAAEDSGLSAPEVQTFQNVEREQSGGEASQASLVGRRLAVLGDEIDAQYREEMQEIVQMSGTPESAFSMFTDIVNHLFIDSETGMTKFSVGRLAALLSYCYHLAKTYLQQHIGISGLVTFLGLLASWLFRYLLKAKFYDWLQKQGGWGSLLAMTTSGWGNHVFLVIGVASLAIWAYSYFRAR